MSRAGGGAVDGEPTRGLGHLNAAIIQFSTAGAKSPPPPSMEALCLERTLMWPRSRLRSPHARLLSAPRRPQQRTVNVISEVNPMPRPLSSSQLLLSFLALTGCGVQRESNLELEGLLWTIDSYIDSGSYEAIGLESPPTIQFDGEGGLQIYDACNTGFGEYEIDGSVLTFTAIGTTLLACDDELIIEAGAVFHSVVAEGESTFEVSGGGLTLMRGSMGLSASSE